MAQKRLGWRGERFGAARVLLALILNLVFAFGAAAAERASAHAKVTRVVGFAQADLANERDRLQVAQLKRAISRLARVTLAVSDGKGSPPQQIRGIEDFIESRVDLIVVNPIVANLAAPAIARAHAQGIPVVMLARGVDEKNFTALIAPDDSAIGREAARHLAKQLKFRGTIALLREETESEAVRLRTQSFLREVGNSPGLKVVTLKRGSGRADAVRAVEAGLRQGVQFDALFAVNDSLASGARVALAGAGVDPKKMPIAGVEYLRETQEALRRREQSVSFTYPLCTTQIVDVVDRILSGKAVPQRIIVPSRKVTPADAERVAPLY